MVKALGCEPGNCGFKSRTSPQMKKLYAKFICAIFGHTPPRGDDQQPMIEVVTSPIYGYHYSWAKIPCTRCVVYEKVTCYSHEEWVKLEKNRLDELIQAEKQATVKQIEENFIKEHNKTIH